VLLQAGVVRGAPTGVEDVGAQANKRVTTAHTTILVCDRAAIFFSQEGNGPWTALNNEPRRWVQVKADGLRHYVRAVAPESLFREWEGQSSLTFLPADVETVRVTRQWRAVPLLLAAMGFLTLASAVLVSLQARRRQQQLRRLEAEKAALEAREQQQRDFMAEVSHTLKTPLTAIRGWAEAHMDGVVPAHEMPGNMMRIIQETTFLSTTVQRILDVSRLEAGALELHYTTFDLADPVMDAVASVGPSAEARTMSLALEGPLHGCQVRADKQRIRDVVQVLLENAVAHAGEGVHVEIRVEVKPPSVQLSIQDKGRGIPADLLSSIFDRYKTTGARGSGIGLAMARGLVEAHGAMLQVESRVGHGTRFWFSLPGPPAS
jgi:signal transduction histidine kinase